MVHFFVTSTQHKIYMGADKYENEDLIRFGLPEDVWFHVDDMSSAHVYLRLNKDEKLEDVSPIAVQECAQLVKANSIEGCKLKEVTVSKCALLSGIVNKIYTRWRNLKKTSDMEIGAIGFHDRTKVKSLRIEKDNVIVKALNKTKVTEFPNLQELQELRAAEFRADIKAGRRQVQADEKRLKKEREEQARLRSYDSIMKGDNMKTNTDFESTVDDSAAKNYEDDFM